MPEYTFEISVPGVESLVRGILDLQRPVDANWSWDRVTTCIYYALAGVPGRPIKIGISQNLLCRMSDLQNTMPDHLQVLLTHAGTYEDERALHVRFEKHLISGEWFRSDPEILEHIKLTLETTPCPAPYTCKLRTPLMLERRARRQVQKEPVATYEEHKRTAQALGIRSQREWREHFKSGRLPPGHILRPEVQFSASWESWFDFLGKRRAQQHE